MTSLSSELKNFKVVEKRVRTSQCLFDNMVDGYKAREFLVLLLLFLY